MRIVILCAGCEKEIDEGTRWEHAYPSRMKRIHATADCRTLYEQKWRAERSSKFNRTRWQLSNN